MKDDKLPVTIGELWRITKRSWGSIDPSIMPLWRWRTMLGMAWALIFSMAVCVFSLAFYLAFSVLLLRVIA